MSERDDFVYQEDESDQESNQDDKDSDQDSDQDKSPRLVVGVTQYQQMGYVNCLYEDTFAGMGMDARTRYKMLGALTSEQTFRKNAKQYIESDENLKKILNMNGLCDNVNKIKKFDYINAKAFVIAYYFINVQAIKKIRDNEVEKIVKDYIDEDVTILDVVRYIRYIQNL